MGTLINCLAILIAGILGTKLGERIPERMRDTILKANGAAVIALGLAGFLSKALIIENGVITSTGTMNMIFSMCLGSAVGSWIDLETKLEQFGEYLKQKTGNIGDMKFTDAFMTASLTVCIGAMAIVGAIEDGINGDMSILLSKAILDFVIILVMASSMGKGVLFSFIPVGILQGGVTILAHALAGVFTVPILNALSLTGSLIITLVGVNLLFGKTISTANLLPALLFTSVFAAFSGFGI